MNSALTWAQRLKRVFNIDIAPTLLLWDNRGALHYAAADYRPAVRKMERVTVIGEKTN
jgi:hypothetical protein